MIKVLAEKTDTVEEFVSGLNLPPGLEADRSDFCLSLNKKDLLDPATTLENNGIRGGDLLHLVSRGLADRRPQVTK